MGLRKRTSGSTCFRPPVLVRSRRLPAKIPQLMRHYGLGHCRSRRPLSLSLAAFLSLSPLAIIIYCAPGVFLPDSAADKRSPAVADDRPGTPCRRPESRYFRNSTDHFF
uniref:Transmembrane protein n=1 Tax=Plectus sambesii TaxID=2011161 RepID=A0A914W1U2_9BILA